MELYDKEYFKRLKISIDEIDKKESFRILAYFIISFIFFIAWGIFSTEIILPLSSFFILFAAISLITPIIMLISIVQYQNAIVYAIVLGIFYCALLAGIKSLWYYINLFQDELNGEYIYCSCSPSHEIKEKLQFICLMSLAILLMSNNIVQSKFHLPQKKWISILTCLPILYLCYLFI